MKNGFNCHHSGQLARCLLATAVALHACASMPSGREGKSARTASVRREDPEIRTVTVEGAGEDRASAMLNARREAVREAVGVYIQSQMRVDDGKISQNSIRSLSDGTISSTTILEERIDEHGVYRVKIMATVINDRIHEERLRSGETERPAVTDPASAIQSEQIRTFEAVGLLREAVRRHGFPLGMFEADASLTRFARTAEGVYASVDCNLRIDEMRWREFQRDASRCLAALGAMDSPIQWRSRPAGRRRPQLLANPPIVGDIRGIQVLAHLTPNSRPALVGPLDNVWIPSDLLAQDCAVMLLESEPETCRAYTHRGEAFEEITPAVIHAATRLPTLRLTWIDEAGNDCGSASTALQLNLSTGVLLLAQIEDGFPKRIAAGAARILEEDAISPTRPLLLAPAIGLQELHVRELSLRSIERIRVPESTVGVRATLSW
jgi:hypothetical protein